MSPLPCQDLASGSRKGLLRWAQQGDMATPLCHVEEGPVWKHHRRCLSSKFTMWWGPSLSFLPAFYHPWMAEGPLSWDNDNWGGLTSSKPLSLLLWALPGQGHTCPSMTYLCILPLCQAATCPPHTLLTCQLRLAATAQRSAVQPGRSSHFTPYWVRIQSKHRPYWHCQILLFQGLGCCRDCKDTK